MNTYYHREMSLSVTRIKKPRFSLSKIRKEMVVMRHVTPATSQLVAYFILQN